MSKVITFKHTDTVFGSPVTRNVAVPLVNFGADWRVEKTSDNDVLITNIKSPSDMPEKFRTQYTALTDVYRTSPVEAAYKLPSKLGFRLFHQHTDIGEVTETTDATYVARAPFSMTLTVSGPLSEVVTGTVVLDFIRRSLAKFYEDNDATANGIEAQLRGILVNASMK